MTMMITQGEPLLLGSGSPRRRRLLSKVGVPLRVHRPPDLDETPGAGEAPDDYLVRIVSAKLRAVAASAAALDQPWAALLVADTAVIAGGTIMRKPQSDAEAGRMLARLAGCRHEVATRYAIAAAGAPAVAVVERTVRTQVWFRPLSAAEIARYVQTGEGRDKAGAYAIQGIGSFLVERIDGSYSNVVGLPIYEVILSLQAARLIAAVPATGVVA